MYVAYLKSQLLRYIVHIQRFTGILLARRYEKRSPFLQTEVKRVASVSPTLLDGSWIYLTDRQVSINYNDKSYDYNLNDDDLSTGSTADGHIGLDREALHQR